MMHTESAAKTKEQKQGRIRIEIIADVNITAPIARRLANVELLKKVGQMIMAGEPELLVDGENVLPFLVVPPVDDRNTYPTGTYALVDAISGLYSMSRQEIEELESASDPILQQLYPELDEWIEAVEKAKVR